MSMRDNEYQLLPPANTTRIAILGTSVEMGSAVTDNEVFEVLIEDKLNDEYLKRVTMVYRGSKMSEFPYEKLKAIINETKLLPQDSLDIARKKLRPYKTELYQWIFQKVSHITTNSYIWMDRLNRWQP